MQEIQSVFHKNGRKLELIANAKGQKHEWWSIKKYNTLGQLTGIHVGSKNYIKALWKKQ